jgi:hypothetical protein
MSPPGRPKGEYRSAQREGTPVKPFVAATRRSARIQWVAAGWLRRVSHMPTATTMTMPAAGAR